MSDDDRRHHRVSRDPEVRVVLVPYPVFESGSPKQKFMPPPGEYKRDQRQPWRPAQDIPRRLSKAEKAARFVDALQRSDQAARDFMDDMRRISWEQRKAREQVEA